MSSYRCLKRKSFQPPPERVQTIVAHDGRRFHTVGQYFYVSLLYPSTVASVIRVCVNNSLCTTNADRRWHTAQEATNYTKQLSLRVRLSNSFYDWYRRKKWPGDHRNGKTRSGRYRSFHDKTNIINRF